ncbi:MAG: hypothetical protein OXC69_05860 [Candidatus Tectomicrobia bacterium]|nr:hypothetical protein [Candidatus Tectomicrobia bacterium]
MALSRVLGSATRCGETIDASFWRDGNRILIRAETRERSTPVLGNVWLDIAD